MKRKIGWFCTYTPIEILEAAGLEPWGIRFDSGHAHEDVYLGDAMCSYVRSCLGGALAGQYDFLEGVVIAHSCECMRRLYDGWIFKQEDIRPECIHFIDVPRILTDKSVDAFTRELDRFVKVIEDRYGDISRKAMIGAIEESLRTSRLLARLNETRQGENPPITGVQVQNLMMRGMTTPRSTFNQELETLVSGFGARGAGEDRPRIMVYGGPASTRLVEAIEEAGGLVVYEHMCNGLRQIRPCGDMHEDPLRYLARSYLSKTACPRMIGDHSTQGLTMTREHAREYRADGIIYFTIKFCANAQAEWPLFHDIFGKDMPVKMLEGDVSPDVNIREVKSFVRKLSRRSGFHETGTEG
jgi:benzoyl-CoA reductase/2-hydroxyglutaryl-CoA dehydratase subunit BcrC/BadD/HgdB